MQFPPDFQFHQGNLQSFMECRRRFYLSSIRRLAWPAIISEPMNELERHFQLGDDFHKLLHQYFLGIPGEILLAQTGDKTLHTWLENFLLQRHELPGIDETNARCFPEISLTNQIAGFRVIAKFDLLTLLSDQRLVIYDWKTTKTRTRRKFLADRMQTRLYRFLLAVIGERITGIPVEPSQIKMIYWFASFPDQPEIFSYSTQEYSEDEQSIRQTILTIQELVARDTPEKAGEEFPLTANEERCAFCVYRSLCARGVSAGNANDLISEVDLSQEDIVDISGTDFSLDQVAEIEF